MLDKLVEDYQETLKGCSVNSKKINPIKLQRLITYTTRPMRPDEVDGVHYRFVSIAQFFDLLRSGKLLEVDYYNTNFYGIPASLPEDAISLIAVNFNGIKNLKRCWGDQVKSVCLLADIETIKQRLINRAGLASESQALSSLATDLEERIRSAEEELSILTTRGADFIDFYVENSSIVETLDRLKTLISLWTTRF